MEEKQAKKPSVAMPRDQLEQHIVEFIKSHNVCVLATARDNIPRATPLEYEAKGTDLYINLGSGRKIENIRANPLVSAAIHDPLHGWLSVKGIQITGQAKLLCDDDAGYAEAWKIFNQANSDKEGWDIPPKGYTLLIIGAKTIELFEAALKQQGYKIRQVWEAGS